LVRVGEGALQRTTRLLRTAHFVVLLRTLRYYCICAVYCTLTSVSVSVCCIPISS
jgi:hypothetical protein